MCVRQQRLSPHTTVVVASTAGARLRARSHGARNRILGKVGGVPALGAGMALVLPPGGAQSQVLKATASPAAREIAYSKVENKEAA
jgi:hypothetical protein